jgi:hypothetical protein
VLLPLRAVLGYVEGGADLDVSLPEVVGVDEGFADLLGVFASWGLR